MRPDYYINCEFCQAKIHNKLTYFHQRKCAEDYQNTNLTIAQALKDILIYLINGKKKINSTIIFNEMLKEDTLILYKIIYSIRSGKEYGLPSFRFICLKLMIFEIYESLYQIKIPIINDMMDVLLDDQYIRDFNIFIEPQPLTSFARFAGASEEVQPIVNRRWYDEII
jgi:hypothetical protein